MSYKRHFYKIEKDLLAEIHEMSATNFFKWGAENELLDSDEENPYLPLYEIGEKFFGLGEYDHAKEIQQTGKPLFSDKELSERYEHYEPYIVGKEAILRAIEIQKQQIVTYYEKMLLMPDEERLERHFDERSKTEMYEQHLNGILHEWKNRFGATFAIDVNETNPAITNSWHHEYSIFELVRLYKHTDWNKYGLLFMGW